MNDEPTFPQGLADRLEQSLKHYDAATASRLNRARQAALEALPKRRPSWAWFAGSLAAAALAAVLLMPRAVLSPPVTVPEVTSDEPVQDDLSLLADADANLELIQNLEFYAWLDLAKRPNP